MERPPGKLFIGESIDPTSGDRSGDPLLLDSADLTTHGVIVGMTGSGKTGLGVVLLEEAVLAGIPVLAIDPKGDLGNLCLTFPGLSADDFEPWVDEGTARVEQTSVGELAASTATAWTDGLASWNLDGADVAELQTAANPVIYTPGGSSGVPLDLLGRLRRPIVDDAGARQDEVDSTVGGLLALVDIESDPLSGREHILLANLITRAWNAGTEIDLPTLLAQILDPPIRKLGVLEIDAFFPPADRQALVLKLNGLLASPSFAAWAEGAPLDIERMLWDDDGRARAAVVSLSHLEETERQFALTLVLSKLIAWMRTQSGTGELRALVYIDEVMGFAPPVGNPPTKKPILTLLKQARAFGVGLVLSTQNPVDLDYKAISNAGTWMVGRLQTEQDKARLVDGLRAASGTTDLASVEASISGLGKRQFMLRDTRSTDLPLFTTRWAMSYLAGPLRGDQINQLMADVRPRLTAATALGTGSTPDRAPVDANPSPPASTGGPTPATAAAVASGDDPALADDESTVAPTVPDSLPVRFARSASPWLVAVGGDPEGDRHEARLAARVELLFDETKADLRHTDTWEAIIPLTADGPEVDAAVEVDFDDRDFDEGSSAEGSDSPTGGPIYVLPPVELRAGMVRSTKADVKTKLYGDETYQIHRNPELKLWSRPGETIEDFQLRCQAVAEDEADADAGKIRDKLLRKQESLETALAKAEDRVAELEVQADGRKQQQLVDIGSSILGGLLGGRSRTRGLASAARRMTSGRRQSAAATARLDSARNRVAEKIEDLDELELELAEALMEIDDEWSTKADAIEPFDVPLEKNDITVTDLMVVWIPVRR